jgi:hypothetical protein
MSVAQVELQIAVLLNAPHPAKRMIMANHYKKLLNVKTYI